MQMKNLKNKIFQNGIKEQNYENGFDIQIFDFMSGFLCPVRNGRNIGREFAHMVFICTFAASFEKN